MKTPFLFALSIAAAACSTTSEDDPERGPIGKADSIGTCEGACGDISAAGDCYCDDLCVDYGDCCADHVAVCVPVAERACAGPLFDAHPVTGELAVEGFGVKMPTPFTTCGAEMTFLYGLADLAPVAELLAGTGHLPVAFPGGKTLVRLYWADNQTSDAGAFLEAGLVFATVESPVPLPEAIFINDYSLVAAGLSPATVQFTHRLILAGDNAELATEVGIDLWGLDKRIGKIKLSVDADRQTYKVNDEHGDLIARLKTHEDPSPAAQYIELTALANAFGLPGPESLPPPAPETFFPAVNERIDAPGTLSRWSATYGPLLGVFHRLDPSADSLLLGADSELGAWLASVHFDPRVTIHYPSLDGVFASE